MNKVDIEICSLLNAYPMLFKTREDALLHIFTNSGYRWDDGCLVRIHPIDRDVNVMDYSDLDSRDSDMKNSDIFYAKRKFELNHDRMVRKHRAENIDIVVRHCSTGARFSYEALKHINFDYTAMVGAPYGHIDPDYLEAAEELMSIFEYSFNVAFSLHYDNPLADETAPEPSMFSRMPSSFQRLKTQIDDISEKLEAQSGKKARAKAFWEKNKTRIMESLEKLD